MACALSIIFVSNVGGVALCSIDELCCALSIIFVSNVDGVAVAVAVD